MPVTMVRDVLDWAAGSSIKEITLLGGEPALHPEFAAIVSLIGRSGLRIRTVTNGSHRFRKAIRDPLIDAGIGRVAVSLDAPVAEVFDKLRGPRAYRDAMSTIEQLREQQKPFDINFTVVRSSLPYVGQMLKFAEDQGARRINMHWFSEVGRARTNPEDETVSPTDWRSVLREVESYHPQRKEFIVDCELSFGYDMAGEDTGMCAVRDRSNLQFFPDGTVFSCGMLVDRPDLAGYLWRDGRLYLRQAESEVTRTSAPCTGCPIRAGTGGAEESAPVALCIYNRLDLSERR